MVPDTSGLYDDTVRTRTVWALREGVVLGAIALFWVAVGLALTVALLLVSVPFVLFGGHPAGLSVATVLWSLVGPLVAANAGLYVLARVGTLLLDRHRAGSAESHPLGVRPDGPPSGTQGAVGHGGSSGEVSPGTGDADAAGASRGDEDDADQGDGRTDGGSSGATADGGDPPTDA